MRKSKNYVIVGGNTQVWAVNPHTKQMLRLKLANDKSEVHAMYVNGSSVYHAKKLVKQEGKNTGDGYKHFDSNYVQVFDTLSGNSILTAVPERINEKPLEDRAVPLECKFIKEEDSLIFSLNGKRQVMFPKTKSEVEATGRLSFNDKKVFYDGKPIATLDEAVRYAKEMDAGNLRKAFKMKNRQRYDKNAGFFKR